MAKSFPKKAVTQTGVNVAFFVDYFQHQMFPSDYIQQRDGVCEFDSNKLQYPCSW